MLVIHAKVFWFPLFNKCWERRICHGNQNIEDPTDNSDTNNAADANNAAEMDAADAAGDSVWSYFGLVTNIILVTH